MDCGAGGKCRGEGLPLPLPLRLLLSSSLLWQKDVIVIAVYGGDGTTAFKGGMAGMANATAKASRFIFLFVFVVRRRRRQRFLAGKFKFRVVSPFSGSVLVRHATAKDREKAAAAPHLPPESRERAVEVEMCVKIDSPESGYHIVQ